MKPVLGHPSHQCLWVLSTWSALGPRPGPRYPRLPSPPPTPPTANRQPPTANRQSTTTLPSNSKPPPPARQQQTRTTALGSQQHHQPPTNESHPQQRPFQHYLFFLVLVGALNTLRGSKKKRTRCTIVEGVCLHLLHSIFVFNIRFEKNRIHSSINL